LVLTIRTHDWESDEALLAVPPSQINQVGEPKMADPNKSRDVLPFTVPPNAIEALERLRDSYKGLLEQEALTRADRAVLTAVEITLKHLARAS
jgi:hypothetical protein